jgi:hypothetical protein
VKSDSDPKLTFWSIPPFRQQVKTVARTIKLRDARLLVVQLYGILYLLLGMKLPILLLFVTISSIGKSPTAADPISTAIPYLIFAMIVCALAGAIAGAGGAWTITGWGLRCRQPHRLQWAIWGALAATVPVLPGLAVVSKSAPVVVAGFLALLFGAGVGLAFHWVVERDRRDQNPVA